MLIEHAYHFIVCALSGALGTWIAMSMMAPRVMDRKEAVALPNSRTIRTTINGVVVETALSSKE